MSVGIIEEQIKKAIGAKGGERKNASRLLVKLSWLSNSMKSQRKLQKARNEFHIHFV